MAEETVSTTTTSLLPVEIAPLVPKIQESYPKMLKARDRCLEAIQEQLSIVPETPEDKEEWIENANGILVATRNTHEAIYKLRTEITVITDKLKEFLMEPEKAIDQTGKDNLAAQLRGLVGKLQQEELKRKQDIEAEAARKKARDDYRVEIETQMRKALKDMVISNTVATDEWATKFWADTTLENFEARRKTFLGVIPKMKKETYDKCFVVLIDKSKITDEELTASITHLQETETFDKWNALTIDGITPILNDWRAKIDEIKRQKTELAEANETEKLRLSLEQKRKDDEDALRKKKEFEQLQKNSDQALQTELEVNKMSNAFVEQVTVQGMGAKGPLKKTLKFTDPALTMKALANIIYHVMAHPEFKGIQKRNAKGELVVDDQNRPEYIDEVQKWINFFLSKCDAKIEGTKVYEDTKVIVRQ